MSQILNQDLINACIEEINSWGDLPKENHLNEPSYIDLSYKHILLSYVLKQSYDMGMEKSDLSRQIIMDLDYWPDATPYQDWDEYDESKASVLRVNKFICFEEFGNQFLNSTNGWTDFAVWMLRSANTPGLEERLRAVCEWNDPNGAWTDTEPGMADHCGYMVNCDQLICQIALWSMEYKDNDAPLSRNSEGRMI